MSNSSMMHVLMDFWECSVWTQVSSTVYARTDLFVEMFYLAYVKSTLWICLYVARVQCIWCLCRWMRPGRASHTLNLTLSFKLRRSVLQFVVTQQNSLFKHHWKCTITEGHSLLFTIFVCHMQLNECLSKEGIFQLIFVHTCRHREHFESYWASALW